MLKILGWIFVPYVMLPFQWKKISLAKRYIAIAWIAIIFVAALINGITNEPSKSLVTTSNPNEQTFENPSPKSVDSIKVPSTKTEEAKKEPTDVPTPINTAASKLAETKVVSANGDNYDVVLHFPAEKYPETAKHIISALEKGETAICTIERKGADQNREESLAGIATKDDSSLPRRIWGKIL